MFTIIQTLANEFNRSTDEQKLVHFRNTIRRVNENIFEDYCKEIHHIMQRHYSDENIIRMSKELLKIIDEIKKEKEVRKMASFDIGNYYITQHFILKIDF